MNLKTPLTGYVPPHVLAGCAPDAPLAVALSFAVSAIDEFVIQAITEGRGPSWRDVGIDCGGAATGVLICILVFLITYYFGKVRETKTTSQI